jgi:hypothetical protein
MLQSLAVTIPWKCGRNDLSLLLGVTPRRITQLVQQKVPGSSRPV